jgi:hypothetical protein
MSYGGIRSGVDDLTTTVSLDADERLEELFIPVAHVTPTNPEMVRA